MTTLRNNTATRLTISIYTNETWQEVTIAARGVFSGEFTKVDANTQRLISRGSIIVVSGAVSTKTETVVSDDNKLLTLLEAERIFSKRSELNEVANSKQPLNADLSAFAHADAEERRAFIGANDASNLTTGTIPSERLPEHISARIQVLSGTDAELSTEVLLLGELAAPTDGAWLRRGDGVTLGGTYIGRPSPIVGDAFLPVSTTATAGTAQGGSGSTGTAGTVTNLLARIVGGNGGNNATSGTGNGGNGGSLAMTTSGLVRFSAGNGGHASGNFNGGNGGSVITSLAVALFAGNGGNAGTGGAGGIGGSLTTAQGAIRLGSGNGGAGGAGAAGGVGGSLTTSVLVAVAGNGGAGGTATGDAGGPGGSPGSVTLSGGAGGTGAGGVAGGTGGAAGNLNLSGSAASGTTSGANGGTINLAASGSTAAPHILWGTASPEGTTAAPVGSIYMRNNAGAGSLWFKTSGVGNTGWTQLTVP